MSNTPFKFLIPAIALAALVFLSTATLFGTHAAEETAEPVRLSPELAKFSEFDARSEVAIDHQPLTGVLKESVFPMSRATKRLGWKNKTIKGPGSNLSLAVDSAPSRYEGNRLMIHAFSDAHTDFFLSYQQGLENLSVRRPLSTFNRDEQLAYWLNLYNVIVMNKIIDEYPISNTKKLRQDSGSFWPEKVTTVEGTLLSLSDIEHILVANWHNPLVIYGLWQGSIGGPSLPRQAFTGENVWGLLKINAEEFVNSNRGVIPKGNRLEVSKFYDWLKGAFDFSDEMVLAHIKAYAEPAFMGDISALNEISYKYYDWTIADLVGGNLSTGTEFAANIRADLNMDYVGTAKGAFDNFPPQAQALFIDMMKEDIPIAQGPTPLVSSEECAPDEVCEPDPEGN